MPATHCQSQPTQIASKDTVGFTSTVASLSVYKHTHTHTHTHTHSYTPAVQQGDPKVISLSVWKVIVVAVLVISAALYGKLVRPGSDN